MNLAKKSLGQHWLSHGATLNYIADAADISLNDTILEIGPGTGTLTQKLLATGAKVIAVEKDETLAAKLPLKPNLQVVPGDILSFDLSQLPTDYKVVANIPYYLTSNLLRTLAESPNSPITMVLLVQREVAERIAAGPGKMSLLAISAQLYYQPELGRIVPAKLFEPPPKVDSRVVILRRYARPQFKNLDSQIFFQIVKAGFSQRRKKLRSSLSGGLGMSKDQADDLLKRAGINPNARAQELSLKQWHSLYVKIGQ
jgi:16S rRNA (adenine1518-N6/adenine1519-N6)-dimethyltransferase